MVAVLFLFFWILNLVLVLLQKKNAIVAAISFSLIVVICFMNTTTGDYGSYYYRYVNNCYTQLEIGFVWLMKAGSIVGLSFNQFQGIVCVISLLIILFVFSKFSDNYNLFFSLYFIYQYFYDIDTLRNFLARAILVMALYWLFNRRRALFLVGVICGCFIHRSLVVYLPLVLFDFDSTRSKKTIYFISVFILLICTVSFLTGSRFEFIEEFFFSFIKNAGITERVAHYFSKTTRFGFLIYFFLHFVNLMLVKYSIEQLRVIGCESDRKFGDFCLFVNLYLIVFFPLIMLSTMYFRFFNNIMVLNFILYSVVADRFPEDNQDYQKYVLVSFGLMLLYRFPIIHASDELIRVLAAF